MSTSALTRGGGCRSSFLALIPSIPFILAKNFFPASQIATQRLLRGQG
jgi:hypothetical protein